MRPIIGLPPAAGGLVRAPGRGGRRGVMACAGRHSEAPARADAPRVVRGVDVFACDRLQDGARQVQRARDRDANPAAEVQDVRAGEPIVVQDLLADQAGETGTDLEPAMADLAQLEGEHPYRRRDEPADLRVDVAAVAAAADQTLGYAIGVAPPDIEGSADAAHMDAHL